MTDIVMGNVAPLLKEIEELKEEVRRLEKEIEELEYEQYHRGLEANLRGF